MSTICLNNIEIYAYHGVFEVEQKVGQWYTVNLEIDVDFSEAALNDDLNGTIDYAQLNNIIREEMAINSKLIEHVANRIATSKNFFIVQTSMLLTGSQNFPVRLSIPV